MARGRSPSCHPKGPRRSRAHYRAEMPVTGQRLEQLRGCSRRLALAGRPQDRDPGTGHVGLETGAVIGLVADEGLAAAVPGTPWSNKVAACSSSTTNRHPCSPSPRTSHPAASESLQPPAQRRPAHRINPAPAHLPGDGVQVVERELRRWMSGPPTIAMTTSLLTFSYFGRRRFDATLRRLPTQRAAI
jgi:hypothetical protein